MPDYSKSIIYTIRTRDSVYVGSTINFRSRKKQHKYCIYTENGKQYNQKIYKTIRENDSEWDMQPYSKYPCKDKLELTIEEEKVRQLLKADLNSKSCGTGCSTKKERKKQYYEQNKNKIDERHKQYYEQNKNELMEYQKQYYETNKDKIKERNKQYQKTNKDKISKRNNQKVTCECGCIVLKLCLTQHRKTKKHLKLIQS